jgi:hypothetical protein
MTIQKLPVPERGQKNYPGDTLPGFAVRVSCGGTRSFCLSVGTERQNITIGRCPLISLVVSFPEHPGMRQKERTGERAQSPAPFP